MVAVISQKSLQVFPPSLIASAALGYSRRMEILTNKEPTRDEALIRWSIALDWLDAYRAKDIGALIDLFSDDAVVECICCVNETIVGKGNLRDFWPKRFKDCGASDARDLQPINDGISISYIARDGLVSAVMEFGPDNRINFMRWGPEAH